MPRARDTQRERLYRAQLGLHFSFTEEKLEIFQVRKLYEKILGSEWAGRQWPNLTRLRGIGMSLPRPKVERNLRIKNFAGWHRGGTIEFPAGPISKVTAVHELAHWIVSTLNRDWSLVSRGLKQPAGHGREFAAVYLALVQHVFGKDAQDMLRTAFVAHGVRYKAKRVLSGATLEAARERGRKLAAARAAKQLAQRQHDQVIYDALVNT